MGLFKKKQPDNLGVEKKVMFPGPDVPPSGAEIPMPPVKAPVSLESTTPEIASCFKCRRQKAVGVTLAANNSLRDTLYVCKDCWTDGGLEL